MVDTPTDQVITEEMVQNAANFATEMDHVSEGMSKLDSVGKVVKDGLNSLFGTLNTTGKSLQELSDLTEKQSVLFATASTMALGASNAFSKIGKIEGISTVSEQFNGLIDTMLKGEGGIAKVASFLKSTFGKLVPDSIKGDVSKVREFATSVISEFSKSADNASKLQSAFWQLSARTGNLSQILNIAGKDLQNINSILANQTEALTKTQKATNLSAEEVLGFYLQLGNIPGALNSVITGTTGAGDTTSMLTATIQLATGSGMKYAEIMDVLSKTFKTYNTAGEPALKFTARMSEIAQNYNIELDEVRKNLMEGADTFKLYGMAGENAGKVLEGTARIMNRYVGALKDSGLSGTEAADTIQKMTKHLGSLDTAQKAFLSSQTGGPGGLMGAYQVEKLMKEDPAAAFEKIRRTFIKQFGKIATVEEAAQSPDAAARLERQRLMLQEGPLGKFASSPQEASRILEAFDKVTKGQGTFKELGVNILKDTMQTGITFQETTATEAGRIRTLIEESQLSSIVPALSTMQHAFGARSGTRMFGPETEAQINRRSFMERGMRESGEGVQYFAEGIKKPLNFEDRTGRIMSENLREYGDLLENLSTVLEVPVQAVQSLFKRTDKQATDQIKKAEQAVDKRIEILRKNLQSENNLYNKKEQESDLAKLTAAKETLSKQGVALRTPSKNMFLDAIQREIDSGYVSTGTGMAHAARRTQQTVAKTTATEKTAEQTVEQEQSNIVVHFKGVCTKCGHDMVEENAHVTTSNPAAGK